MSQGHPTDPAPIGNRATSHWVDRSASWLATVTTALLVLMSEGLTPQWPAAWLSALPALALAPRRGRLVAFTVAVVGFAMGRLGLWKFFALVHMPIPIAVMVIVAPALIVGLGVLLFRALLVRDAPIAAALSFPALMVSAELAVSWGADGTWGARAYSQMNVPAMVQIASVTGLHGVSFLLAWFPAFIAVAWHRRAYQFALVAVLMPATSLGFGMLRLSDKAEAPSLRVGLAAALEETSVGVGQVLSGDPKKLDPILDAYAREVTWLAREGASVVVLPEEIVGGHAYDVDALSSRMAHIASSNHVTLIAGARILAQPRGRNVAWVFGPEGELLATYQKQHLVTGFERELAEGRDLAMWPSLVEPSAPVRLGVAICKDMDFAAPASRYGAEHVSVLFVPAWDFGIDGWLHARMAMMRGIEQGVAIVRTAESGRLTVSDAWGRVLAEAPADRGSARLVTTLPVATVRTLYSRIGDAFAYGNVALLVCVIARLVARSAARSVSTIATAKHGK
jgi:apolipoprotein N-acyltransferase